jgi:hypothetical protein
MSYATQVFTYIQSQIVIIDTGYSSRIYMPQYSKPLSLHKGVDNQLRFQFLNQEQKPVNITGKSITCRIINGDGTKVLVSKALTLQLPVTGIATLDLNAAEIENISAQKAYYSLEIPSGQFDFPVFIDQNAGARGDLNIVNSILPSFVPSEIVTIPSGQDFPNTYPNTTSNYTYYTSVVNTQDNPILTVQAQYNEYEGNVVIQGSTIPDGEWYTIIESDNYSNITDTKGYTIIGFHPFVRLQFNSDQGEVDNILAR